MKCHIHIILLSQVVPNGEDFLSIFAVLGPRMGERLAVKHSVIEPIYRTISMLISERFLNCFSVLLLFKSKEGLSL